MMIRSSTHLSFIRRLPCIACGASRDHAPIQAAHVRFGHGKGKGGVGLKPSDDRVVPMCADCHRDQHNRGEPTFWAGLGIDDPLSFATRLFEVTGDETAARRILFERHFL